MRFGPLRRFMLGITALGLVGIPVELLIGAHYHEIPQLIPFVTSAIGVVAIGVVALWAHPLGLWGLRGAMLLVGASGLFGVFEHVEHNAGFVAEIYPNDHWTEHGVEIITGANPILAPAAYVLLAALGWGATLWGSNTTIQESA